jgi:type II secretory ATPase GspE/PulE/Tfp pilus assembly ATPase PilB-like protein
MRAEDNRMEELIRQGSLTEILFRSQMVTEADVRAALEEQRRTGGRLGELFVSLGIVTQEDIDWALSSHLDIPLVKLDRKAVDPESVKCVPGELARRHGLIPLLRIGDEISVAMIDPLDKEAVRAVEAATGCSVTVSISRAHEIQEMQELFYGKAAGESLGLVTALCLRAALAGINADLSGARCVELLLERLAEERWDALVGQPRGDHAILFARAAGSLREVGRLPKEGYRIVAGRFRALCRLGAAEAAQKGAFEFPVEGRGQCFQALFLAASDGDCMTVSRKVLSPFPDSLGQFRCEAGAREALSALAAVRRGLVLFCGQDEEERCRMIDFHLDAIESAGRNVMLFGGTIGRGAGNFPRVSSGGRSAGETQALLMAAIDHDPDVVAIEDVSDSRLFVAAGKAAMRGKLVLAGLPFDDRETLFRHLSVLWRRHAFFPTQLRGIVSCRGVLTLCPDCREEYAPEPDELSALALPSRPPRFHRAAGCPACNHTGFGGRSYLLDVVPVTRGLLDVFEASRDGEEAVLFLRRSGNGGLEEAGRRMLAAGEISPDEYLASFIL